MRYNKKKLIVFVVLLNLILTTNVTASVRPSALLKLDNCELWAGKASGNDNSVFVELSLCYNNNQINGILQWSSLISGWNKRKLIGNWSAKHQMLILKDQKFLSNKPKQGWQFCLVDRYQLERTEYNKIEGIYYSSKCKDTATIFLTLERK